ncbi:response regulator transcription factor [Bacillus sp. FJAT-49705]|uniref:Response regulator transcription factor n=1 Tax=Cytobacillus citreus TaxID=2833586 RepID=A0ABS5NPN5_9BACI|nr:response regulator transcription factor [Cytobacillus citreus]MBS4189767.1 response regulator transcription factor [Cytobacillus citreus]
MIKVLIVDDHPTLGEGTRTIIDQEADMKATFITDIDKAFETLKEDKYDIYLIDLYMPKVNGIELSKMLLQVDPDATILIYTGYDIMSHYNLLIEAGVAGFISKTAAPEQLITAIRCALRDEVVIQLQLLKQLRRVEAGPSTNEGQQNLGDITLSSKEQQILDGISKGLTNKAIAIEISMSQRTIEYNLTKIFSKLGVGSRTEALLKAKEFGLLSLQIEMND